MAIIDTFFVTLAKVTEETFTDIKKVRIVKQLYLLNKKEDILQAKEVGYTYNVIAEVATSELLELNIPKSYIIKDKEGKEITRETKFNTNEIKNFCEPSEEV